MVSSNWIISNVDEETVRHLQAETGLEPVFCKLLALQGVKNKTEAISFFKPSLDMLHHPFAMRDMDKAVKRLDQAIESGEKILLYGDYDVDGTTSVAMMYAFLSNFHQALDYYLPDRDREGYGVSLEGVDYAHTSGCTLIIAMDCGIKAHAAVDKAKQLGIDFIICDHHLPEGGLPDAVANLDPKRIDCDYPFKELSGCGIAFKLAQALALQRHTPAAELYPLLDFVAISTACDIVPMIGENRILTKFGLEQLNRSPRVGLHALLQRINRRPPLDVEDLVFGVGPLINSAGRLGDAGDAVKLLLSSDMPSALEKAGQLVQRNRLRREVDMRTLQEARNQFQAQPSWETRKTIVLYQPDWHKGIIGIAASRIAEAYYKPTVILTRSNGRVVGSARSVRGFDLYAVLQSCEDLFYSFGGHAHAAGMQMPESSIDVFARRFEEIAAIQLTQGLETPELPIISTLALAQITPEFVKNLRYFEPFGPANRNPVFWAEKVRDTGNSKILDNNHARLSICQAPDNTVCQAIAFGQADVFDALRQGFFDLAFSIKEEHWRANKQIVLHVKEMRPST